MEGIRGLQDGGMQEKADKSQIFLDAEDTAKIASMYPILAFLILSLSTFFWEIGDLNKKSYT